jgi:predicted phosphodiesterase
VEEDAHGKGRLLAENLLAEKLLLDLVLLPHWHYQRRKRYDEIFFLNPQDVSD